MEAIMGLMGGTGGWVIGAVAKATLLLSVAWLVASAFRRASASTRHMVWSAAVVGVLILPLAMAAVPWRLPVLPASPTMEAASPSTSSLPMDRPDPVARPEEGARAPAAADASFANPRSAVASAMQAEGQSGAGLPTGATLLDILAVVWALGFLALTGRIALGGWLVRRIVAGATPLTSPEWSRVLFEASDRLDLTRTPALLMSSRMPMPFASGLARPAIVLPEAAREWSERRQRVVLCHELAHVRRSDLLVNMLGRVACALYWFHPLVWVAARRLRAEGERAADDMVLGLGTRASEYAEHLLHIVCRAGACRTPAVAVPMAQKSEFEGRMMAILEAGTRRGGRSRRSGAALAGLLLVVVLPLAAMAPAAPPLHEDSVLVGGDTIPPTASKQEPAKPSTTAVVQEAERTASRASESTKSEMRSVSRTRAASAPTAPQQVVTETRIVAALVGALDDSVVEVRDNAAYALGKREAKSAVDALGGHLVHDPSGRVRETCAWALGQIESPASIPDLAAALKADPRPSVRATVVWAMGQIEDPAAVPALTAALSDSSGEVRGRAAWALGTIQPKQAPTPLVAALGDPSRDVRLRAAWALGQIGDTSSVSGLVPLLSDQLEDVRSAALWALSRLDGNAAREALLGALEAKDPAMRAAAVRALAGGGGNPWPWPWPDPRIR